MVNMLIARSIPNIEEDMTKKLKAQLFDEIVANVDNDDRIVLDNGILTYRNGQWYIDCEEDYGYSLISALTLLGYRWEDK